MAGWLIAKGAPSSAAQASPSARLTSIARRVGSDSAEKIRSSSASVIGASDNLLV